MSRTAGCAKIRPAAVCTLQISAERALWAESSIKLTYLRRNFEDQLQDIDLNHVDGVTQNPGWGDIYQLGNFNSIDYEAFVLALTRRQYRGWQMQLSYTWSEAIGDGEDFFSRFCHAKDEEGRPLEDREIIDHLIFLMMAAHDTTTSALTSLLYELAVNSSWQDRVRDEIRAFVDASLEWIEARIRVRLFGALSFIDRVAGPQGRQAQTWPTGKLAIWAAILLGAYLALYYA